MDNSRFHGGPILAVTSLSCVWGLVSAYSRSVSGFRGVAGSVGMHIEDVIGGNKSLEGNDLSAGTVEWGDSVWVCGALGVTWAGWPEEVLWEIQVGPKGRKVSQAKS